MYARKTIGIIGGGFVGQHVFKFFSGHHKMYLCDLDPLLCDGFQQRDKSNLSLMMKIIAEQCDFAFVCVNTPKADDGECDLGAVEGVIAGLDELDYSGIVVIKSTVEPGTTDKLSEKYGLMKLVFSPEYASMSKYWSPHGIDKTMVEASHYIFGGARELCGKVGELYLQIGGPTKKYVITNAAEAEMTKYVTNCFYAVKVGICNEFKEICDKAGIDWTIVREAWLNDPRVSPMHTAVFEENRGFGNACLSKDSEALRSFAKKVGSEHQILSAAIEENKIFRRRNKDNSDDPYEI